MIETGKQRRRETGRNRHGLHRANHARKSDAKIKRAGWIREKRPRK